MSMAIHHFISSVPQATPESSSRRSFLKASGLVAGGLMVGFWWSPEKLLAAGEVRRNYEANAFITIGRDDGVTLTMAKIEMGQGTYTSLPMLIAEELEVDLNKVVVRH